MKYLTFINEAIGETVVDVDTIDDHMVLKFKGGSCMVFYASLVDMCCLCIKTDLFYSEKVHLGLNSKLEDAVEKVARDARREVYNSELEARERAQLKVLQDKYPS